MKESLNIYQRISKVMEDVHYLKKNATVGYGQNTYTAITHDDVSLALNPAFRKHGIVIQSSMDSCEMHEVQLTTKKGPKQAFRSDVWANVKLVNIDDPKDLLEVKAFSMAFDGQDKAPGKAYSMAVKYCLLKTFMIATGDREEDRMEGDMAIKKQAKENNTKTIDAQFSLIALLKERGTDTASNISKVREMRYEQIIASIDELKSEVK